MEHKWDYSIDKTVGYEPIYWELAKGYLVQDLNHSSFLANKVEAISGCLFEGKQLYRIVQPYSKEYLN
jgi:hypothetical protein